MNGGTDNMAVEPEETDPVAWLRREPEPGWRLIERGAYAYATCADQSHAFIPSGVEERYARFIRDAGDGSYTRSYRDTRQTPAGVVLQVETWRDASALRRMDVSLQGPARDVWVRYDLDARELRVQRKEGTSSVDRASHRLPLDWIVLPLTRDHLGPVIVEIGGRPDHTADVVVPALEDIAAATVLDPVISRRDVRLVESARHTIEAAGATWSTQPYRFLGGPYDDRSAFWICGESDRLIRYIFTAASGVRWSADLVHLEIHPP
ncbi:MAG: hypothetical protein VX938_07370 [Myxococcota bacterium]|nr:hypothetical protein [Myxococcota bacterium]